VPFGTRRERSKKMSETTRYAGPGFLGWLALIFIALKLTNYIDWSWWWVLSPLWIPLAIVGVIVVLLLFFALVADRVDRS
jgi:hypothetical protein